MNIGIMPDIEISGTELELDEAVGVAVGVGCFEFGVDVGFKVGLGVGVGEDAGVGEGLGETAIELATNVPLLQGIFTPTLSVLLVRMLAPERLI